MLTYEWSTSDGRTATGADPVVDVHDAGHLHRDPDGHRSARRDRHVDRDRCRPPSNQLPPTASFTATPTSGRAPLTVALDGRASSDPEGGPLTYAWSSSDGQTATGAQSSLTFTQAGTVHRDVDGDGQRGDHRERPRGRSPSIRRPAGLVAAFGFDEVSGTSAVGSVWVRGTTGRCRGRRVRRRAVMAGRCPSTGSTTRCRCRTRPAWI